MGQVIEQSSILTQTPRVDSSKDKHLPSMTVLSWGRVHIYPTIGIRGMNIHSMDGFQGKKLQETMEFLMRNVCFHVFSCTLIHQNKQFCCKFQGRGVVIGTTVGRTTGCTTGSHWIP